MLLTPAVEPVNCSLFAVMGRGSLPVGCEVRFQRCPIQIFAAVLQPALEVG